MNMDNLQEKIKRVKDRTEPKRKILWNIIKAFLVGGSICLLAECIFVFFNTYFFEEELSNSYTILVMIFLATMFTAFGLYDKLGQFAGCGSIVPITGFANSMTSSAIEAKSEGLVLGVLNNIFKLAGSVIVVSIVCGVVIGLFYYLGGVIFG